MELNANQVRLSDGRVVTMRETSGRDEIAASGMLGAHFTQDAAGINLYTKALVMRAIVDIDGAPVVAKPPIKFKDFTAFWSNLKTRDGNKLTQLYQKLNSDGDENSPLDEDTEAESEDSRTTPPSENQ